MIQPNLFRSTNKNKDIDLIPKIYSDKLNGLYTVIDLFCGCGGLSLGFQKAGFKILAGIDNDPIALSTFKSNLKSDVLNADLANDEWHRLLQQTIDQRQVDVIIGGPPCQGYSLTGTRNLEDSRNILYDSIFRAMDFFKPKVVLIENVKGMSSLFGGQAKKDVLMKFHKRNYKTDVQLLNAASFGVPQTRQRLFFLASNQYESNITLPNPIFDETTYVNCETAISDLPSLENTTTNLDSDYISEPSNPFQTLMRINSKTLYNHEPTLHKAFVKDVIKLVPEGGNYKDLPKGVGESRKFNEAWTRYHSKKPSKTIDTGHRNHFHYKWNRVPTVRENARLQTFPDKFVFQGTKTQQYKHVGNAVPVFLGQIIAETISRHLSHENY